jgi:hypothetical protein
MDFLNSSKKPKSPKTPDGPPPRLKLKSKSSSSHKQTLKTSKSSPKLLEPKSPDVSPPRSKSKSSSGHKQTLKSSKSSPKLSEPKSPDRSPPKPKPKSKSSTSSSRDYGDIRLKMPIPLSDKINYNAAVAKKMDKIFQSHENVAAFTGSPLLANLFYLYLFKKYKMNCILVSQDKISMHLKLEIKENMPKILEDQQNDMIKNYANKIAKCIINQKKIIIIPMTFFVNEGAHANLLIYRENTNEIEHFEPHGNEYSGPNSQLLHQKLNEYLGEFVKQINKYIKDHKEEGEIVEKIILVKAHDVCPVIRGVQALESTSTIPINTLIEPSGYCEAWSMFFTELCLKNPEIPSKDVYEAIMEKTELYDNKNDYLRNVIRGYTNFINNKIAKHFSEVFREPMSSAKIQDMISRNQPVIHTFDAQIYYIKLLEIMEMEEGPEVVNKSYMYPIVKDKYKEFSERIRPETSSSSLKSKNKVASPKRKGETSSLRKKSSTITKKVSQKDTNDDAFSAFSFVDKKKMSTLIKEARQKNAAAKQIEKEEKAAAKERAKVEKERAKVEKERAKVEKERTKAENQSAKPVKRAIKVKTKTIGFEEEP